MEHNNKFARIEEARMILELPELATMIQIKRNYRRLVKKWHPDLCKKDKKVCKKMAQKINDAYRELMAYCEQFQFSFSKKEVEKYISPEEWWYNRFGNDPLWGRGDLPDKKK